MIMQRFVDREEELTKLREAFRKNALVIIYGRRRVGKTRLIIEAIKDFPHIYHLCKEEELHETLKSLSIKLFRITGKEKFIKRPLTSLEEFFEEVPEGVILVFDEFQILARNYPRVLGLLQEYVDFKIKGPVVLCGSSVSMMEELTEYGSPIYGRRTLSLKVKPLEFFYAREFFPRYSLEDSIKTYGAVGGIPEYLLRFDEKLTPEENIRKEFFERGFLYSEAEFLLRYELRDLSVYNTILEGISYGHRSFGELRSLTELDGSKLSRYLHVLVTLGIVKKETPITLNVRARAKRRNTRYSIADNYFAFYYSFVHPFKEEIELGLIDEPWDNFELNFNRYLGFVFEEIAKQFLLRLNTSHELPFKFTRIGRWWHKNEEIDLVALNEREKRVLLAEVKWKELNEKDVKRILQDLKRKSELLNLEDWDKTYCVIAKKVQDKESSENILVYDLDDFTLLARRPSSSGRATS